MKFTQLKIYYQRSNVYLSVINFSILFATLIKVYNLPVWCIPIAVVLGILGMLFIGLLDYRFVLEREQKLLYDKVPQIRDLKK